ncbi:MAG: acyltransferase [Planctomycetaceae bacterium]|nr:acyltransferase [Planctomycetaceae bacterium]
MKTLLKRIVSLICGVVILPATLLFRLQTAVGGRDSAFAGWTQLLSLLPGTPGVYLRHAFLRQNSAGCLDDACVSFGTIFSHPDVKLGRHAYVGNFCSVGNVTIGDDVLIASHVSVMNGTRQHGTERLDIPMREQPGEYPAVSIGNDTWIGERATIAANVGAHCIIGAGALVLTDIPDYSIAVGVPAKIIRSRLPFDSVSKVSGMELEVPCTRR